MPIHNPCPSERVAVFDVDGTLLKGDTFWIAARRANTNSKQIVLALACLPWFIRWKLGSISTELFKHQAIKIFEICAFVNAEERSGRRSCLLNQFKSKLNPEALKRLHWHKTRGDRVILCSASPQMLLEPLAQYLQTELICTELSKSDGLWFPTLSSLNCKGPEKVRRLEQHLGSFDGVIIEVYGDSIGDKELLNVANYPHYRSFVSTPCSYPIFSFQPLLTVVPIALLGYGLLGIWSQGESLTSFVINLWPEIGLGLLLVIVSFVFRYGRWRLLITALEQNLPVRVDARIWMGSYAFAATPGKAGIAVRAPLLKQECQVKMIYTICCLLVERITDVTSVLLLLLINLPLLLSWKVPIVAPVSIGIGLIVILYFIFRGEWGNKILQFLFQRLLPRKLHGVGVDGIDTLRKLLHAPLLINATLLGAVSWSFEGASLWLLLKGIGQHVVGIGGAIITHTAAGMFGALSFSPGGLGTTEAGTIGLLAIQGVDIATATPLALIIRLMTLWFSTFIGLGCLLWSPRNKF